MIREICGILALITMVGLVIFTLLKIKKNKYMKCCLHKIVEYYNIIINSLIQ